MIDIDKEIAEHLVNETEEDQWEVLVNEPVKRIAGSKVLKLLRQIRDEE